MAGTPLTDAINALTTYSNTVTGASDTTLSEAVATLASGYGGGGGVSIDTIASAGISGAITITANEVKAYAFAGNSGITKVSAPNATSLQKYAFYDIGSAEWDFPNVESIDLNVFQNSWGDLYLPKLTTIGGAYNFTGNSGHWLVLPRLTTVSGSDTFRSTNYTKMDLGSIPSLNTRAIYQGSSKTIVILRNTSVVTLANADAIQRIDSNTTVYVPTSLIASYQSHATWGAKGCTFSAIEGSPYESLDWYENQ